MMESMMGKVGDAKTYRVLWWTERSRTRKACTYGFLYANLVIEYRLKMMITGRGREKDQFGMNG